MISHLHARIAGSLLLISSITVPALAAPDTFVEDFLTTEYKDPLNTTAWWDTTTGELKLYPFQMSITGSLDSPGTAQDIVIVHTKAFITDGSGGLVVIDITDPAVPGLIGVYDTPGDATALALDGNHVYVADGANGLVVVDITNPGSPLLAGSLATGDDATGIAVDGDHVFLACASVGLLVVDVSSPTTPTLVGSYATPDDAIDVAVDGDQAYVAAAGAGLIVLDVSDPTNPMLSGSHAPTGTAEAVAVDGDLALLAMGASGLAIVDVVDPTNPLPLGSVATPGPAIGVMIDGDFAYVTAEGAGFVVINIGAPSAPVITDALDTPGGASGVDIAGAYAYVADGTAGLQIIEMRKLVPPALWASHTTTGSANDVAVAGDYAYLAVGGQGVEIVDISDPSDPQPAGSFSFSPGVAAHGIDVAGNLAYVAYGDSGLVVLDIEDPLIPLLVGSNSGLGSNAEALAATVVGNYAYVAHDLRGLGIFDVSDPSAPALVANYNDPLEVLDVAVDGNYAYLACGSDGMHVLDISDPTTPVFGASDPVLNDLYLRQITLEGDQAITAGLWAGSLEIVLLMDVTDPLSPVWNGGGGGGGALTHDLVSTGYLLFDGWSSDEVSGGFSVIDISDPTILAAPIENHGTPGPAHGLDLAGDFVFLAGDFGLEIVRIFDRQYLGELNVGQSLPFGSDVAAVKLTTTQTGSITWEVAGIVVWPDLWLPTSGFPGSSGSWRSTHEIDASGVNPTCSQLTLEILHSPASIDAVADVPDDQGGWVRVHFTRSGLDFGTAGGGLTDYVVWRRVDAAARLAGGTGSEAEMPAHDAWIDTASLSRIDDAMRPLFSSRESLTEFPPGVWEILGGFPAMQQQEYIYLAPTQADSSGAGPAHSVYLVTAHKGSQFWVSEPDSGSSVDNIAPSVPEGFRYATETLLVWEESVDDDFNYFTVYGSYREIFDESATVIGYTTGLEMDVAGELYGYYHLTAADFADNESGAATLGGPLDVPVVTPTAFALHAPVPNPFVPRTSLQLELPGPARVTAAIFDLSGRRVRSLLHDERLPAGGHELIWDGRDQTGRDMAAGVYFLRLETGGFTVTRRLTRLE